MLQCCALRLREFAIVLRTIANSRNRMLCMFFFFLRAARARGNFFGYITTITITIILILVYLIINCRTLHHHRLSNSCVCFIYAIITMIITRVCDLSDNNTSTGRTHFYFLAKLKKDIISRINYLKLKLNFLLRNALSTTPTNSDRRTMDTESATWVEGEGSTSAMSDLKEIINACEIKIWPEVIQMVTANPGLAGAKDKYGKLPLHWILRYHAPLHVIQCLHQGYPAGVKLATKSGEWLPLHYAAWHHAPVAVMKFLWRQYPEAVTVKDKYGHLPKDYYKGFNDTIKSILNGKLEKQEMRVYAFLMVWERVYTLPAEIRAAKQQAAIADEHVQSIANDIDTGSGNIKHTLGRVAELRKVLTAAQCDADEKSTAYTALRSQQSETNKALASLPLDVIRHHIAEFIVQSSEIKISNNQIGQKAHPCENSFGKLVFSSVSLPELMGTPNHISQEGNLRQAFAHDIRSCWGLQQKI